MPNLAQNQTTGKTEKQLKVIETELGQEKLCIECQEYWPLDNEFWWTRKSKSKKNPDAVKYEAACKCCYNVRYRPDRVKGTNSIKSMHERAVA